MNHSGGTFLGRPGSAAVSIPSRNYSIASLFSPFLRAKGTERWYSRIRLLPRKINIKSGKMKPKPGVRSSELKVQTSECGECQARSAEPGPRSLHFGPERQGLGSERLNHRLFRRNFCVFRADVARVSLNMQVSNLATGTLVCRIRGHSYAAYGVSRIRGYRPERTQPSGSCLSPVACRLSPVAASRHTTERTKTCK